MSALARGETMDITQSFIHIIGNVMKKLIEQNSAGSKIFFEHGYCTDGSGNVYLRILDWPTIIGKKAPVEIRWPTAFCKKDASSGELFFTSFANIYFLQEQYGYANAHVWGSDGRLCRGGVLIQQPFALLEAILDVLLQKNTTENSLRLGRPCPDSSLLRNCEIRNNEEFLKKSKTYQMKLRENFKLKPEVFQKKEYYITVGNEKVAMAKYAEGLLSHFVNTINSSRR